MKKEHIWLGVRLGGGERGGGSDLYFNIYTGFKVHFGANHLVILVCPGVGGLKKMAVGLPNFHLSATLPTPVEWVNPIKREGMDGVFRGLAGLLRGISRGRSPREIPRPSS